MAINIYREPSSTSTPYSPVYFDVSSDLGTITSMIADVYVNSSLVGTFNKEPLLGTTNSFRFEVGDVLKKHFTNDIQIPTSTTIRQSEGSALNYHIRAFEVLDNGTTFDSSWSEDGAGTNYAQSSTLTAFDGIMHHQQQLSDYTCSTSSDLFLTNVKYNEGATYVYRQPTATRGIPFEIGFLCDSSCDIRYLELDSDLNVLSDSYLGSLQPTNNKAIFQISGSYNASAKYFRFRLYNSALSIISSGYSYIIVDGCEDDVTIFWKNQYGSYDQYSFGGNYKKSAKSRQKTYSKRLNYNHDIIDRGDKVRLSDNRETFTVYTQTEDTYTIDYLHEILQSTDVYLYSLAGTRSTKELIPIIVTNGSSQSLNDDDVVTQFSLTYELANKKKSQLG